ncbi:hypothetical protein [Nostoc sp.]|uniref:hypothetical protein n=1 Tax=Nostoc sp. TaxID=1180 RepID=UPI002FF58F8C
MTVRYIIRTDVSSENSSSKNLDEPIHFKIYRAPVVNSIPSSDSPDIRKMGEEDISYPAYLSPGEHSIKLISGTQLEPNTAFPNVVVEATYNDKKSTIHFRKWMLGAVAHGFNRWNYYRLIGTLGQIVMGGNWTGVPDWENNMVENLKKYDKYDYVMGFNWTDTCGDDKPHRAVEAGVRLSKQIVDLISTIRATQKPGDVVDIHLIGHSRGTVIVTEALNDLLPRLRKGEDLSSYIEFTLLDPHPANNYETPWADFGTFLDTMDANTTVGIGLNHAPSSWNAKKITEDFQGKVADPSLAIPQGIKKFDVWYQHTEAGCLTNAPYQQYIMNLWGLVGNKTIQNSSGIELIPDQNLFNLTTLKDKQGRCQQPAVGHNQVPDVYEQQVVETGRLNRSN